MSKLGLSFQTELGYQINIPSNFHGFKFLKYLGNGSTCAVVLVQDEHTKKLYSAKVISKNDIMKRNMMNNIEKEISIMKTLNHPNILKIKDSFEMQIESNEEYIVIILEYCKNGDLLTFANQHKFKNSKQRLKILYEFLSAVKYLHNNGISHGDLKAENILISANFKPKLCDFGYCRTCTVAGDESKNGTIYYAAPELIKHGQFDTLKSDIWAIGILLYSIAELEFPFIDGDHKFIAQQIKRGKLAIRQEIDVKLLDIVHKCTNLNPGERPNIDEILKHDYFSIKSRSKRFNMPRLFAEKQIKIKH